MTQLIAVGGRRLERITPHLIALGWYGTLAVFVTWPLVLHFSDHVPGAPGEWSQDVWQQIWNIWWVREALLVKHTNPYTTDMLFYPQGASLYLHSLNLPLGLMGIILIPIFGLVPSYNLLNLLILILPAYGCFLLARHVMGEERGTNAAAFIAGVIVLCSPHRLVNMRAAQVAILSDYAVPLILLTVLIALERKPRWAIWLAAGSMLLAGLSKWYHLFHALIALTPLGCWQVGMAWRRGGKSALLAQLMIWGRIGGLATVFILPFLAPAVVEALTAPYARKDDTLVFSADLCALIPKTFGGIWESVEAAWNPPYVFAWTPLLLAVGGVILVPRRGGMWALMAGVCFIISLGPRLHINGQDSGIPMPYALFRVLPVFNVLRAPGHLNAITTMLLAIVAAGGIGWVYQHIPNGWGWFATIAITGLIVVEGVRLPFPLLDATVSPFFSRIAEEPGAWSLLEFPLDRPERDRMEMYTQTYHRKYILTGLVSRNVPRLPYESAPPIAQVELADTRTDIVALSRDERDALLRSLRVRYVVIHRDPERPERAARQYEVARQVLGPLTLVHTDQRLDAYRLDAVAEWLDTSTTPVEVPLYLGLDLGWEPPEMGGHGLMRWLPSHGGGLWTYAQRPRRAVLELYLYSIPGARPLEIWLNDRLVQTLPIQEGLTPRCYLSTPLDLPSGPSFITLRAPQPGSSPRSLGLGDDPRSLTFGIHRVQLHEVIPR